MERIQYFNYMYVIWYFLMTKEASVVFATTYYFDFLIGYFYRLNFSVNFLFFFFYLAVSSFVLRPKLTNS